MAQFGVQEGAGGGVERLRGNWAEVGRGFVRFVRFFGVYGFEFLGRMVFLVGLEKLLGHFFIDLLLDLLVFFFFFHFGLKFGDFFDIFFHEIFITMQQINLK